MTVGSRVRSFAFYTPAFQPTVETDVALGRGWTEWQEITSNQPLFNGHRQPRLPADLGCYDLRLEDARNAQAALATAFSIDGFIYSHYWFEGRRLYSQPRPDIDFALCWKNEDFCTPEGEVIANQTYSEQDDFEHAAVIVEALRSARCIRIDDKPLFVVQNPTQLPNPSKSARVWRDAARAAGIEEIMLAYCESSSTAAITPESIGFDACIESAPLHDATAPTFYGTLETFDYLDMASGMLSRPEAGFRRFSTVTPGFDSSPLLGANGSVYLDSDPSLYRGWLVSTAQRDLKRNAEKRSETVVFVNSWNDWACGSNLEPCSLWATQYLDAHHTAMQQLTKEVSSDVPQTNRNAQQDRVTLSVVIVVNENPQATMDTLQTALNTCTDAGELEFIVVDNGSRDETAHMLSSLHREIFSIRNNDPMLASEAWQQGLHCVRSDYVLFISNDVRLQPGWLEPALSKLIANPDSSAVMPRIAFDGQLLNSQPLTMTTGVCLLARSSLDELPTEAKVVEDSVVGFGVSTRSDH